MNRRLLTILLIAFVIAGGCSFLVYRIMGRRMAAEQSTPAITRVVAAASDIKLGTVLTAKDLTTVRIEGTLPQGAILKPQEAIGRGVISDLYQGEPILQGRLAAPGSGGGLAATIPKGKRACAVRVDQVVGLAGFATPGMRVDVLAMGTPPGEPPSAGTVTKTILQNIEVLSAGTNIQRDAQGKPHQVQVVNLLVTPQQAQLLSLASNQYKIQLVLRNPLDTSIVSVPSTDTSILFGGPNGAQHGRRAYRPAPKVYSVVVSNGASTREAKFRAPGGQQ